MKNRYTCVFTCRYVQTSEVNQGNNLEHDFTCVLTVLMFPVRHLCPQPLNEVALISLLSALTLFSKWPICSNTTFIIGVPLVMESHEI